MRLRLRLILSFLIMAIIAIAFLIPGLRGLLGIVPLSLQEWLWVIGIGLVLLVSVEIGKAISNRIHADD